MGERMLLKGFDLKRSKIRAHFSENKTGYKI